MVANVLMYVKPGCPFCAGAEGLFSKKGVEYQTINYFELSEEEVEELAQKTDDWPTAPMIFINDKFIGGFDDLEALDKSGELDKLLEDKA